MIRGECCRKLYALRFCEFYEILPLSAFESLESSTKSTVVIRAR